MGTNILICDDHRICCLGLRVEIESILKDQNLSFTFAYSGKEASDIIEQQSFDFIFMDLKLSDGSGLEVIRRCKAHLKSAKVIIFTGERNPAAIQSLQSIMSSEPIHAVIQKSHSEATMLALLEHFEITARTKAANGKSQTKPFFCEETEELLRSIEPVDLTKREIEVIKLVVKGLTTGEIATQLGCSQETVKTHRSNMLFKTKTRNFAELSAWYSARFGSQ